jgi:hypothetical protein
MRNVLAAFFFVIVIGRTVHAGDVQDFVTLDPEPENYAWWGRAQFHPYENQVRGIPVRKIRENWCKASEFRRELFPQDLQADLDSVNFAIDGFFEGSEAKQTALVGAYETCDGEKGGFFLILDWARPGAPTVRFIEAGPTDHAFAQVDARESSIWVWYCMCCDFGTQYKWDESKQNFVQVPEEY